MFKRVVVYKCCFGNEERSVLNFEEVQEIEDKDFRI